MSKLKLSIERIKTPGIFAAKLWLKGGSRMDPINKKGLHQLIGSLLSRGCGPYNHIKLADVVEGCGANLRCDTFEDALLISIKCLDRDIEKLLPIVGWMISSPHMASNQVNLEKDLIIKTLNRQKENPFQVAFDVWRSLAYKDGPYGHDPLGNIKDLLNIERSELLSNAKKFKKKTIAIAIAGSFPENIESMILNIEPFNRQSNFCKVEKKEKENIYITKKINSGDQDIKLQKQNTGQVVIIFGQPTISHRHKDDLCLRLLSCYCGYGMTSLLFRILREKFGVAYEVGVHHPYREFSTPFIFHASTSIEKSELTLELLQECWWKLSQSKLSNNEVELTKAKFAGQIALSTQTVNQRTARSIQLLGLNLPKDYDRKSIEMLNDIKKEDLQEAAINNLNKPLLSLSGPNKDLEKLKLKWISFKKDISFHY